MYIILLMLTVAVSSISFLALKKRILYFLKKKNLTKQNYTGNQVLGSGGLLILIPCILAILPCFLISPSSLLPLFITMMLALAFCGMLDDLLGDSSSKGLIDHIGRLLDGSFSSGILKALTGGLIGFFLAWSEYHGWVYLILDTFVFALSVNTINLLDLKPGRAIKGFAATLLLQLSQVLPKFILSCLLQRFWYFIQKEKWKRFICWVIRDQIYLGESWDSMGFWFLQSLPKESCLPCCFLYTCLRNFVPCPH